ncbi:MAG TPA: HTTM domain-containing protein [Kofleriaceae bacterium]|nr:HTTM domain-containing protein [Kofleriaceae bacterium]
METERKGLLARLADRTWVATPAERLAAVRLLVGLFVQVYFALRLPHMLTYVGFPARQFEPIGVLWLLESPPPAALVIALGAATWLSGLGFLLGWRFRVTGPLHALLLLASLTYCNSWGQIFHTENMTVIYVLVLAVTRAADAYSLDARRRGVPAPHGRYGWPLALLMVVAVACYFIAGVAKVRWGGSGWAGGEVLRHTIAADSMRKVVLGSQHSPVAELLLGQVWLFRGLAVLTLVVELGAPLALLGRRIALVWVVAVLGFHFGVFALMAILFPFPMTGVAFAPFFRPERLIEWVRGRVRRLRGQIEPRREAGLRESD